MFSIGFHRHEHAIDESRMLAGCHLVDRLPDGERAQANVLSVHTSQA